MALKMPSLKKNFLKGKLYNGRVGIYILSLV